MSGYNNRTIQKSFPDLGDDIEVTIRNPKLMPPSMLLPRDVKTDPATGRPLDAQDALEATLEVIAKLVVKWTMYDPMSDADTPPVLDGFNVTNLQKVPGAVIGWMSEQMSKGLNGGDTDTYTIPASVTQWLETVRDTAPAGEVQEWISEVVDPS